MWSRIAKQSPCAYLQIFSTQLVVGLWPRSYLGQVIHARTAHADDLFLGCLRQICREEHFNDICEACADLLPNDEGSQEL